MTIQKNDIELIRRSRSRNNYTDFSEDERDAHQRVHAELSELGQIALEELGGSRDYVLKLTSGFHPTAGVRGGKPKDLWFGVYRRENAVDFLGNPQVFMIVSGRGVEYGFSPLTHPDDFSNASIKRRTRGIAKLVLDQLPAPGSAEAEQLAARLTQSGTWRFRPKQRLDPDQSEYRTLDDWLSFVRSDEGVRNAGGGITRYANADKVDAVDLAAEVRQTARLFRPLMERIIGHAPAVPRENPPKPLPPTVEAGDLRPLSELLRAFLREFAEARKGAFQTVDSLWNAIAALKARLETIRAVQRRPDLRIDISVGQGGWAAVPWIALLNTKITQSTQEGMYVVFLIGTALDRIFLTLNQGTTNLVNTLGQREAQKRMIDVATKTRALVGDLADAGFVLDNNISLGGSGWRAKNYEIGTIAHFDFETNNLPNDDRMNDLLEAALDAYDRAINAPPPEPQKPEEHLVPPPSVQPYRIEHALTELFLERPEIGRLLDIWAGKKNLILQGAPGVGKSFVAKRLAYLLLGERDPNRVETIQFHQSYSYEDFVQGYRPDGKGGFTLRDGVFYRFCEKANLSPSRLHVFMIDEINRGNLSKILGELMLLIENDKRGPEWAAALTYSQPTDPRFFVPENVYLIGMMNTADRSLSMVDYALRRRFSFARLEPRFGTDKFKAFLLESGVPKEIMALIVARMTALNDAIGDDRVNLGLGYQIGHSFFVPPEDFEYDPDWYRRVIDTEICPLLEEYWFDEPDKAEDWRKKLLEGAP